MTGRGGHGTGVAAAKGIAASPARACKNRGRGSPDSAAVIAVAGMRPETPPRSGNDTGNIPAAFFYTPGEYFTVIDPRMLQMAVISNVSAPVAGTWKV